MRVVAGVVLALLAIAVVWWGVDEPEPIARPVTVECRQAGLEANRVAIEQSYRAVTSLVERYREREELRRRVAELAMRFSEYQRAWEVGRSRDATLEAIVQATGGDPNLDSILARGTSWHLSGTAGSDGAVDSFTSQLRARVSTLPPSTRYIQHAGGRGDFVVSFATPHEFDTPAAAPAQAPLPEVPEMPQRDPEQGPCWNPGDEEVMTWKLAEARIRGFVGEKSLAPDLVEKGTLEDKMMRLRRSLKAWDPQSDMPAVDVMRELIAPTGFDATVEDLGVRTFEGIRVQSHRIEGRGTLAEITAAVRRIAAKGALVGDLLICDVRQTATPDHGQLDRAADPRCAWAGADLSGSGLVARIDAHIYDSY